MSSVTHLRRVGIGGLSALVAATALIGIASAPASAAWPNQNATIGIVDTSPGSTPVEGAKLLYQGQSNQSVADIEMVVPNNFHNGDAIDLAIFDRAAQNRIGQANADAAHKLVWSPGLAPTVSVDTTPYDDNTEVGPFPNTPGSADDSPDPDTSPNKGSTPPAFTTTLVQSSRSNGLGADILRLTATNQAAGHGDSRWIVKISGLKMDTGDGVTPGDVKIAPFAYAAGATFGTVGAPSQMFSQPDGLAGNPTPGNLPDDPTTPADELRVVTYTVPAYVSPVAFNITAPTDVSADGTTTNMGDVSIAESSNFSLQDGTYTIRFSQNPDGSGGTGVEVRNGTTGDPITGTVTGGSGESVDNITTTTNSVSFDLNGWTNPPNGLNGPNSRKATVVLHGLQLADTTSESFYYHLLGGSIDSNCTPGCHSFLQDPGDSVEIPAGYSGNGDNQRGVPAGNGFYKGLGLDNQQDIQAPALVFPGHSVSLSLRIGGENRYATAAKIALSDNGCASTCPDLGIIPPVAAPFGNKNIVLASGENFPDALSANYLATSLGTDILLTRNGFVPDPTLQAIRQLGVQRVYIVGGTGAVSSAVSSKLANTKQTYIGGQVTTGGGNLEIVRLGGANRYDTNKTVNEYAAANSLYTQAVGRTNITFGVPTKLTALVATGADFPDALGSGAAVSGAALTVGGPIPLILTNGSALSGQASSQLSELGITQAVIVGGTGVVSDGVASAITGAGVAVKRVAGDDRYATATALADFEVAPEVATSSKEGGLGFDDDTCGLRPISIDCQDVVLATGEAYADALAAGPFAATGVSPDSPSPIVLTRTATLSPPTQTWLTGHKSTYVRVEAVGLGGAVSEAVLEAANTAIS